MLPTLNIGDRLHLSGGYEHEPHWLQDGQSCFGCLVGFIPGQKAELAAVVKLDTPISVDGITGEMLVLELRYTGATWTETETVHVELCSFVPEQTAWQHRPKGKWVESHAKYQCIQGT